MDSLTQIVVGIATAEAIAGKELKNRTFLYGAILGTLPDLDILANFFISEIDALLFHRGISHSILFFLIISPFLGFLIAKIETKISYKKAVFLVFMCLLTHVLIDLFTTWGTQVLWPLENRFSWKTIFVIDPLYTIPLALFLAIVFFTKNTTKRQKMLHYGLIISTSYLALSVGFKLYALHQFEKELKQQNIAYQNIIVKPSPLNIILWNANVKLNDNSYLLGDYSVFDKQPISFQTYKTDVTAEKILQNNSDFNKLVFQSEDWYIVSRKSDTLVFNDLRFGVLQETNNDETQFAFSYQFIPNNNSFIVQETPKDIKDGKKLLQQLWSRVKGN